MHRVRGAARLGPAVFLSAFLLTATPVLAHQMRTPGEYEVAPGTFDTQGESYDAVFGIVWVPMNRNDPESPTIRLQFVRILSRAETPLAPIVYLAGGPGGSGTGTLRSERFNALLPLLEVADIVGFDQRGTGASEPADMVYQATTGYPLDQPGGPALYNAIAREQLARAIKTMRARGIDLDGFTTEQSADDLADLANALGVEKLTLWGSSYGTHLALATVRRHPEVVDRVILAGTEGPDHSFKLPTNIQTNLERLAALAASDTTYARLMPDLLGTLAGVLGDLGENPRTIEVMPGVEVVVGPWDLQKMLSEGMGDRRTMQGLPAMVYAMSKGEFADLGTWAFAYRQPPKLYPMSFAMDCASWATDERLLRIEAENHETLLGAAIDYPYPYWCEAADLPRLHDDFRAPVVSKVPALFISGTLDGRTPVTNADEIAQGFSNSVQLVIRNASHGGDLFHSSPQIVEVVRAFVTDQPITVMEIDGPTWTFDRPYERSLEAEVIRVLASQGYDSLVTHYKTIRKQHDGGYVYDFQERRLNVLGYALLRSGQEQMALDVLRLNTVAYPEAFNTWDSLGECYMTMGETEKAIENYKKSLELNPENANATRMLAELEDAE
jgi:pimeloyl-ACP methyl ester carboxylesterase